MNEGMEKNTLNQFLKEVFEMYEYDRANYSEEYNPNTCYEGAFDSVWDVWKSEKRKLPQFKFNRLKKVRLKDKTKIRKENKRSQKKSLMR